MTRLFVFESHPVQYHAPVYRALHRICQETNRGEVRVFYATDASLRGRYDAGFRQQVKWDEALLEGYPATVMHTERGAVPGGFGSYGGNGVRDQLRQGRPDAILLTGLAYQFDWAAYVSALAMRIPIWLRVETQDKAFARSKMKTLLRRLAYAVAYQPIRKALVIGRLNAEHFSHHGLSESRQVSSPYCVVDRFANLSTEEKGTLRARLRRELGFNDQTTVLLFCGKLQPKKQPLLLLDALAAIPVTQRSRYGVLYVGAGELEIPLRTRAREIGHAKIVFAGFRNQTELAPYYLASDVLVLPSRQMGETWGLVANEALLAERRVILSKHVGCHADFGSLPAVRVFDGSLSDFVEVLRALPPPESTAGQRDFMRRYSVEAAAEGIARAMGISNASDAGSEIESASALDSSFSDAVTVS